VQITSLSLHNFRCFEELDLTFEKPIVLFEGKNGSGKSTIIEALFYVCYLKSFRTHRVNELIHSESLQKEASVGLRFSHDEEAHHLHVGISAQKKSVKLDGARIHSYKDIMQYYRALVIAEGDLSLIQEGPEHRRNFLNQQLLLEDPGYIELFRQYRHILNQRNALLHAGMKDGLELWSKQLWDVGCKIRESRKKSLAILLEQSNLFMTDFLKREDHFSALYTIKPSERGHESFESFWRNFAQGGVAQELRYKRTLFGAHLDDVIFDFNQKNARIYASRGQQKLFLFLLKLSQLSVLKKSTGSGLVLLLDDFITDFDESVTQQLLYLIEQLPSQVFITCPLLEEIRLPSRQSDLQTIIL